MHKYVYSFFFFQGLGQLTKMIFLVGLNVFLDYLGFHTTAEAHMVAIFETLRNSVLSLFKKQQTFNFNMGHGILHSSYKEAAKVLMKRNMPEVLDNTQKRVIFLPETHLKGAKSGGLAGLRAKKEMPTC